MALKKIIKISTIIFTLLITKIDAQVDFNVPMNLELKVAEDYARLEGSIVNAAKWLEQTDMDKETAKRKEINAYVLQWVSGSPTVEITLDENLEKIYHDNIELMGLYMASYSSYVIQNKNAGKLTATKAAIKSMLNVYKKGIAVKKNKEMAKLLKMNDMELEAYVAEKFKN